MKQKKTDDSKLPHTPVAYMAVPRQWLVALVGALVVPWIAVASIWLKPERPKRTDEEGSATVTAARSGKWGELTLDPIIISPPMELVFTDWGFLPRPTWFFPGANADTMARVLQSAGVSAADVARLREQARPEPRIAGVILAPDPAWVRALDPEIRSRIYHTLARSELNVNQAQAFRYPGSDPDRWFNRNLISDHTRRLIDPLIYNDGGYMLLSDIELVRSQIDGNDELRRLGKAFFQQPTVLARLSVDRTANLDALVEYWGRGGRRTEVRPLIESVAGSGKDQLIDIASLLPPFARNHLYCYPKLSAADLDRPAVVNCLWTSLNFFRSTPDDRFLDAAVALKALKEDYFLVEGDFELGDIVLFLDEKGDVFHAAVYIADNLVFSKNGISAMAPWTFITIDEVRGYYNWRSENPRLLVHRRKDS